MKEITYDLLCELDEDELRQLGDTLSSAALEYDLVEARKKDAMKELGDQLKELRGSIRRLSGVIRRKAETRPVQCAVEYNTPVNGTKRIARMDTGEFVRDEPMTSEEFQNNMFGEPLKIRPN